ncbi:histidine--tRNA ligase [Lacibacter sediminis]|uniref:Histidine--tRNA ligase n=1 Tax=Lacibacter sediminis TaxID=2760713 RepID=A0A7G5XIC5_9BACT|nr:histidine--tRNA ligase [Lacibacter sediminis]QNA45228.1 histidine--tRNA ligase [Lacibacter sediminis]
MAKVNVSLPQGTRDFGADVVRKRNYIFNTIKSVFELYGFEPLETPAMENLETLMGKYGEEGDKLIFKILNNGLDNPAKQQTIKDEFEKVLAGKNTSAITERALKYDLTIPFARYVAMNHNQLTMPFKRYQVQPVWRADRPQKGRYREFYQCDADVVGSKSLLNEVELTNIYSTVFQKLGVDVEIKINSRKILAALAEICGGSEKMVDITVAIDKLDKIGLEKVKEELVQRGLTAEQISIIEKYLLITGSNQEKLQQIKSLLGESETGKQGIKELETVNLQSQISNLQFDFTLARGLNYYTGIIFEVKAKNVQMGSIGGGGRYDDLTGLFGVPNIPGVGISFGVDRIYDVMEELKLFPAGVHTGTKILFFNLGDAESKKAFELMQHLRSKGVACELYHENSKFDKQFKYAEKKQIPFIVILGTKELESGTCNVKELATGVQESISFDALLQKFSV